MNWLNLCSGGETGRQAVRELGLEVTNWFTSEVDKFAIKVANDTTMIYNILGISVQYTITLIRMLLYIHQQ